MSPNMIGELGFFWLADLIDCRASGVEGLLGVMMRFVNTLVSAAVALSLGWISEARAQDIGNLIGSVFREIQRADNQRARNNRRDIVRWVVVASRTSPPEAVSLAESYVSTIGQTFVAETDNGRYAIVAAYLDAKKAKENLEALTSIKLVPQDSFLSGGQSFRRVIWSSNQIDDVAELVHQPALRSMVTRLQSALAKLEFYRGELDGAVGPATTAAFRHYVASFGPIQADVLNEEMLRSIEATASDGFKSDVDRMIARNKGFTDALSYSEAATGGFDAKSDYAQAKSAGFNSRVEYDAFRRSGFSTKSEFEEARTAGFTTRSEMDAQSQKLLRESRQRGDLLLSDAESYLRLNSNTPGILEIAEQASALKEALSGNTYETIEDRRRVLSESLLKLEGFERFQSARTAERDDKEKRAVAFLSSQLAERRTAIRAWIAQNLTNEATPDLTDELKGLEAQLVDATSQNLTVILASLDDLLVKRGVKAQVDSLLVSEDGKTVTAGNKGDFVVARTPANRFLLDGNGSEVVALYNASPSAPSLVKNLAGGFLFETEEASVCTYPSDPSPALRRAVEAELLILDAQSTKFKVDGCSETSLMSSDIVLLTRRDFLTAKPSLAIAVLDKLENGELRRFEIVADKALTARQLQEQATRAEIAEDIESGARNGYGAFFTQSDAAGLCVVLHGDQAAHDPVIADIMRFIESEGVQKLSVVTTNSEGAYKAFQRRECSAVYAETVDLKALWRALAGDGVATYFAPIWYDVQSVSSEQKRLSAEREQELKLREERRIDANEEKRIAKQQEDERSQSIAEKTKHLRDRHSGQARALETFIAERVRALALNAKPTVTGDTAAVLSSDMESIFPGFASWYRQSESDDWSAEGVDFEILEYGLANWKQRKIDAIALKADFNMVSPERGERKQDCIVLGLLFDEEFNMNRDPVEFGCAELVVGLETWRAGHQIESLWHAK